MEEASHVRSLDSCSDLLTRTTPPRAIRVLRAAAKKMAPLDAPPTAEDVVSVIRAYDG